MFTFETHFSYVKDYVTIYFCFKIVTIEIIDSILFNVKNVKYIHSEIISKVLFLYLAKWMLFSNAFLYHRVKWFCFGFGFWGVFLFLFLTLWCWTQYEKSHLILIEWLNIVHVSGAQNIWWFGACCKFTAK